MTLNELLAILPDKQKFSIDYEGKSTSNLEKFCLIEVDEKEFPEGEKEVEKVCIDGDSLNIVIEKENEDEPYKNTNLDFNKFKKELEYILNKNCLENGNDTPDFILAEYLLNCLKVFNTTLKARDKWYGFNPWKNIIARVDCSSCGNKKNCKIYIKAIAENQIIGECTFFEKK